MKLEELKVTVQEKFDDKHPGYVFAVIRLEELWQQLLLQWTGNIAPVLQSGGAVTAEELDEIRDNILIPARHTHLVSIGFTREELNSIHDEELMEWESPSDKVN